MKGLYPDKFQFVCTKKTDPARLHLHAGSVFLLLRFCQHHRKGRAFSGGAFNLYLCAGQLQNPLDQRHAEAVALGGVARVALVEFVVDMLYRLFIHATVGSTSRFAVL